MLRAVQVPPVPSCRARRGGQRDRAGCGCRGEWGEGSRDWEGPGCSPPPPLTGIISKTCRFLNMARRCRGDCSLRPLPSTGSR